MASPLTYTHGKNDPSPSSSYRPYHPIPRPVQYAPSNFLVAEDRCSLLHNVGRPQALLHREGISNRAVRIHASTTVDGLYFIKPNPEHVCLYERYHIGSESLGGSLRSKFAIGKRTRRKWETAKMALRLGGRMPKGRSFPWTDQIRAL